MVASSAKLTLLVLLVPVGTLAVLDIVTFHYYGTPIIEVSNLLSSILVFLLVWERLRESLTKKLEYLHKNYMELSNAYKQDSLYFTDWKGEVKRIVTDLEAHGKFLGISLYPSCLNKIDKLLSLNAKIEEALKAVDQIAQKELEPYNRDLWYYLLGIRQLGRDELHGYTLMPKFSLYEQKAKTVEEEQTELLIGLKSRKSETEKLKKELLEELEEFLRSNNLSLEPKY